ncbi:MAG: chromosomal replication initiator protein DnaA [Rhodospirillaceae bacterium]|nr:MAG: chromosomal replication initiator protein DnaA [Rhodospirillaceae bacterium]
MAGGRVADLRISFGVSRFVEGRYGVKNRGDTAVNEAEWDRVKTRLKQEFGETAFKSWVKPITPTTIRDGEVELAVPTRFMRDWITTHYGDRIRALWSGENPSVRRVTLKVAGSARPASALTGTVVGTAAGTTLGTDRAHFRPADGKDQPRVPGRGTVVQTPTSQNNLPLGAELSAPLDARYTFENFVVGKPNEFAYAAAKRVAESDQVSFNPLFLYGGVGLGKTHLMHAIAWEIRQRSPQRKVVYLSAEKFMYSFVRALRNQDTVSFKEQFRSVDVLMIDDVQFISGKDATQEEFFHTFNALVDQGRQLVLSADKSPSNLEEIGDRLRSRLASGLVADLHPTTFELRLGILDAKAEQLRTQVPQKVKEFLAHKITANVRELEGALTRLVAHAQLVGGQITLETTQDLLQDLLRAHDRRLSMEEIQKRVAEHFKIRISDMSSARRARAVARPRQVAMYLSKQLTSRSLPEIGRAFGGRDHTTVMHAVRKVEELVKSDSAFAEDVELLTRMLES